MKSGIQLAGERLSRLTSEHFIDRTSELLRQQCGGDVTMSMVLGACCAQKGSLYHFFPGGKDELLAAAVEKMKFHATSHIRQCLDESDTVAEGVKKHLLFLARCIEKPDSTIGMPFLALAATVGATNHSVRVACDDAIQEIESLLGDQLGKEGFSTKEARTTAALAILAIEGSILQSRVRGDSKPIKLVASSIYRLFSR